VSKIYDHNNLEKEKFILRECLQRFSPWSVDSISLSPTGGRASWWKGVGRGKLLSSWQLAIKSDRGKGPQRR
ncbi:hypothetical protein V4Y02_23885, partial [Escherichia coli]